MGLNLQLVNLNLEIAPLFPPHSILPHSHHKGTCSFNRPRLTSLNRIRTSTELLVKNFFFQLLTLFSVCEPPNHNPPKRVHCSSNSPANPSSLEARPGNTLTPLSVTNFLSLNTSQYKQVTTRKIDHHKQDFSFLVQALNYKLYYKL